MLLDELMDEDSSRPIGTGDILKKDLNLFFVPGFPGDDSSQR